MAVDSDTRCATEAARYLARAPASAEPVARGTSSGQRTGPRCQLSWRAVVSARTPVVSTLSGLLFGPAPVPVWRTDRQRDQAITRLFRLCCTDGSLLGYFSIEAKRTHEFPELAPCVRPSLSSDQCLVYFLHTYSACSSAGKLYKNSKIK